MERLKPKVSVVVRTKNEEQTIRTTLEAISRQNYHPYEILLIDDGSTDGTVDIAGEYCTRILQIDPMMPYNHAYACNLGIDSSSGNIVVLTNGHALPISYDWLESGARHFVDDKIAGTSGYMYPKPGEIRNTLRSSFLQLIVRPKIQIQTTPSFRNSFGLFNTVSGALRKDYWRDNPFDETFSGWWFGGEDKDWAFNQVHLGRNFIVDPGFSVYHSHNGTPKDMLIRDASLLLMSVAAYQRFRANKIQQFDDPNSIWKTPYPSSLPNWKPM